MKITNPWKMVLFWAISCFFFFMPLVVSAATYTVSTSGNDANAGSADKPWRTIQKAANTMVAGDRVVVTAGTYNESVATKTSGKSENYIEFAASGTVNMMGFAINGHDYIKINGFTISGEIGSYSSFISVKGSNCLVMNNTISYSGNSSIYGIVAINPSANCTFRNNILRGLKYPAIAVNGSHHLFEGNLIENCSHDAFRVFGDNHIFRGNIVQNMNDLGLTHMDLFQTFGNNGDVSYNILIENNHFRNCAGTQIGNFTQDGVADIRDWTFRNNIFENINYQANIFAPGFKFYNNTFYHSDQNTGGPLIFNNNPSIGVANGGVVMNNLFIDCGSRPLKSGWYLLDAGLTGFQADYNYVAGPESAGFPSKQGFDEAHGINGGDPKFVSISGSDFGLQADSPAIDSGAAISGFNYDKNGKERPLGKAWDRGAYEGAGQPSPKGLRIIEPGPSSK